MEEVVARTLLLWLNVDEMTGKEEEGVEEGGIVHAEDRLTVGLIPAVMRVYLFTVEEGPPHTTKLILLSDEAAPERLEGVELASAEEAEVEAWEAASTRERCCLNLAIKDGGALWMKLDDILARASEAKDVREGVGGGVQHLKEKGRRCCCSSE